MLSPDNKQMGVKFGQPLLAIESILMPPNAIEHPLFAAFLHVRAGHLQ
jgi:hypothetical protein